ncbi:hypothetical protein D9613_011777 [Agrocybe pediades]|uniref:Uncharacterized protein n=1 Tax=Agrocybe pediades TaxID=84607 RepID=A0A8H4QKB8_9AGAR|nr:hypothetical protein D9613_011777 [Agrocybe pediades]
MTGYSFKRAPSAYIAFRPIETEPPRHSTLPTHSGDLQLPMALSEPTVGLSLILTMVQYVLLSDALFDVQAVSVPVVSPQDKLSGRTTTQRTLTSRAWSNPLLSIARFDSFCCSCDSLAAQVIKLSGRQLGRYEGCILLLLHILGIAGSP